MLFEQGFGSRRDCRIRILGGQVVLDGQVLDDPDEPLPEADESQSETPSERWLVVEGRPWPVRPQAVVMLHKPVGTECSLKPRHHPSVMSLLHPVLRQRGVQPVGRLDEDTTGLLLLTDDGELNHRLTSPKWHAPKVYRVTCRHPVDAAALQRLLEGVVLDDDPEPVRALAVEPTLGDDRVIDLTLGEGRYHQVKRMLAAVSNRVEALHRTHMAGLALPADLPVGHWRWLALEEETLLRSLHKVRGLGESSQKG